VVYSNCDIKTKGGESMDKTTRAVEPRSEHLYFATTRDVRGRLEAIAKTRGWSLSKTIHLAVQRGLWEWAQEQKGAE
jgi:hypothetical protein